MSALGPDRAEPISVRIPEAVRLTGLSRSRIYELMKSGDIAFAKVGSSTLIVVESLRQFVYAHARGCPGKGNHPPGERPSRGRLAGHLDRSG